MAKAGCKALLYVIPPLYKQIETQILYLCKNTFLVLTSIFEGGGDLTGGSY